MNTKQDNIKESGFIKVLEISRNAVTMKLTHELKVNDLTSTCEFDLFIK